MEEVTVPWVADLILAGQVWVVGAGEPHGLVWVTEPTPPLHATIHALLTPAGYRALKKADALPVLIQTVFDQTPVEKLKAQVMRPQSGAIRLLKHLGFKHVGTLKRETLLKGQPTDVWLFELHRAYWHRRLSSPPPTARKSAHGER